MEEKSKKLGTENIKSLLTRLSIPAIIGMVFNALYNLVDTIFVGRLIGPKAIGGMAIVFPVHIIIIGLGIMVGVGTASLVSRNLGANNKNLAYRIAGNSFFLAIILGIIVTIVGEIFLEDILILFGATENILHYSRDYMQVILLGATFLMLSIVGNNIVRAEGNAKIAMITMIVTTVINIILDPILISVFDMGMKGAAYATVFSRFLGFSFLMIYFLSGKSDLKIELKFLILRYKIVKNIILVGLPTLGRTITRSLLIIVVNNSLKFYGGDIAISIYGILNRLILFSFMPMFGMVQGFQPIVGFNYGAQKFDRVVEVVKVTLKRLVIYSTIIVIFIMLFPNFFIGLFTKDQDFINMGVSAIRVIYIFIPLIGVQILTAVFFQALGKVKQAFVVSMSRQLIFFIPFVLILPRIANLGLWGVWIAFPVADLLSILLSASFLRYEVKKCMMEN